MRTVFKIIGITVAVVVFLLVAVAVAVPYFYKDEIMHVVTEKVGKQIKADISLSKVDVSVFGNIPTISIQMHDVFAKSTDTFRRSEFSGFSTDTAFYAERVLLSFNVLDFLFKNYVVQQVVAHDAKVNFFMDSQSHHNWGFSIESDSSGNDMFVELSKIRFRNTMLEYHDAKLKISASEWFDKINFAGKFQGDDFFVDMFAAFTNKRFVYNSKNYFPRSSFKCDVSLLRDSLMYVVKQLKLETPVGLVLSEGTVQTLKNNDYSVNLSVNVETTIEKIMKVLPQATVDSLAPYKLRSDIFVEGNVKGKITQKSMPGIVCNVACTRGNVLYEKTKYSFTTKGTLKANDVSQLKSYSYTSSATAVETGNSKLTVQSGVVSDFEHPKYSVAGSLNVNIDDIAMLMKINGYGVSGNVEGTVSAEGKFEDVLNFSQDFFKKTKLDADLQCTNLLVSAPEDSPYDFSNVDGHILFSNGTVSLDNVSGKLQSQAFTLQGKASDFVQYLYFDNVDTHCNMNCTIESINLTPFYNHYKSLEESSGTGKFLGSIRLETKKLDFDPYYVMNLASIIRFTERSIEFSEVNATTLQGRLTAGSLQLTDMPNNTVKCVAAGQIEKMSAKDIFTTFDNFDQSIITANQIDGSLSGSVQFSSLMDSDYNPIYSTANALADIVIEDGSVNNVETLMEIGKKMKMQEEFTNVSFSTLKNTICLKNDTLYIPAMNITASAFEMLFSGKHNIENNEFSYYVTVFLKKTLSLKFRNKNKETEDFGEIEKNNDTNLKIPIKIIGNPDDYTVDYDFKKSKENVKTSLESQKSEWKEILGKDLDGGTQEKPEKKEEPKVETDFQIQWD
ncbi:MAG: hypothetical protein IK117_03725 [Bacteroidales bacterium]|nr:hypothetical protein [Bacteroidales bacterium]